MGALINNKSSDPITLASEPRYESRANKLAKLPISQKWMAVLSYHLAGKSIDEIASLTGYALGSIRVILANQKVNELRQELLRSTQEEFEALFGKITNKIRDMIDHPDTAIDAIKLWIQMHGRGGVGAKKEAAVVNNITAEDVVFQILNQQTPNTHSPHNGGT